MLSFFLYLLLAIVSTGVIWYGSSHMESTSEKISEYFELPSVVQGAIIVALGSSFPEFSTVLVSTLVHQTFELGVSAIVGSAIFNILFIPSIASLGATHRMGSTRTLVYKEAQFYIISVAALLLMFCFAVIYYPVNQLPGNSIEGEITRVLALIPILLYGLYVFVQYKDSMDYNDPGRTSNQISIWKQFGYLVISLIVILVGVEGLVRSALEFGDQFGTDDWFWGLTIVAAGTSIPDLFMSIHAAKEDRAVTSMANVFGSNIFDLLICIPAGVMIAGPAVINFTVAAPLTGILILATVILFAFLRTDMSLSSSESLLLLCFYGLFMLWMGLESFGVIDLLAGVPPPEA